MNQEIQNPLNAGQQAAADGFFEALFNKTKELIISGPGGVGKTFLMGYLIDEIMPRYHEACKLMGLKPEFTEVVMTATTNKAAEVLGRATNRPAQTVHSFFNLKVQDNYSSGKSEVTKTKNWTIHHNKIIFIDEYSLIDRHLLNYIREGTCNCMVIYVGDHCQLPPVMETISPVYNQRLPFYELTEPMRTNDPHLQAVNLQLRASVEQTEFWPIKIVPGVIDHLDDEQMEAEINSTFGSGTYENRILAYTNQRVVMYNDHIRNIRQITDVYQLGEQFINNSAIQFKNGMLSVEAEVTITYLNQQTEMMEIESGVEIEIIQATLVTSFGDTYLGVPLPIDKDHFNKLVAYYRKNKNWNRYFYLKNNFPDLRQRDAATVHKAQGSSYDTVFIDLGNLSTCHNPNQAARLLYVAFSRARKRVVLYGELAEKYGGLVH